MEDDKSFLIHESELEDELSVLSDDGFVTADEVDEEVEKKQIDIDEFLKHGGECGRYQVLVQGCIMFAMLPMVYPIMIFYYIGYDPPWRCLYNNNNITRSVDFNKTCSNSSMIFPHDDSSRCDLDRSEWNFDYHKSTLVTEFDLVCNKNWLDALTGSIVFVGWGIGIIISGFLSDRYGRKRILYPCLFMALLLLLLHAVVNEMWQLLVIRFLMGIFYSAPALNSYIMVMELIGPNKRVMATTVINFMWPIGALAMTLKAKYIDSWRIFVILCSAPYLLGVVTALCVPESVRWLNLKGRTKEAEAILRKAAKYNKKILPYVSLKPAELDKKHGKKASYIDLLKRWKLAKSMLAQAFIWFQSGMTYYGLNWAFADLGGDMYSNFILSFLVELPGVFLVWLLMQKIGRKKTCILMCSGTALACFGVACVPKVEKLKALRVALGLIGKFMISNVFVVVYMWSSEIYPTVLRTQGMGINIVTSRIGAATSPFIKILDQFHVAAPFALMVVCAVTATLLALTLPETLGKPTRETLDDMISDGIEMRAIYSLNEDVEFRDERSPIPNDNPDEQEDEVEETDPLLIPEIQMLPAT
ncbi:solute carrier family 22 member 15-like [Hydractinia symbiolongicarpus]|uniref:solute carrier family 22 member 15-like n=1 Tax=Hydractinia symbiolongicarpus TaxID=13093 RepID=UPI00254B1467|nr:solute carrier family 22 member 15-like [Hydractinia symbiolongicarpus]